MPLPESRPPASEPPPTHPAVLVISTQQTQGGEDEQDRSAQAVRLAWQEGPGVVLAFAHLKTCMVVMALSGNLSNEQACQLVAQLAQTLVLVAGPPESWLVPDLSVGAKQPIMLRGTIKVLLDNICLGLLSQLQGPGWRQLLPGLVLKDAVPQLRLAASAQQRISALLVTTHPVHTLAASTLPTAGIARNKTPASVAAAAASSTTDSYSLLVLVHMDTGNGHGDHQTSHLRGRGSGPNGEERGGGEGCGGLVLAMLLGMYEVVDSRVEQALGQAEGRAAASLLLHIRNTEGDMAAQAPPQPAGILYPPASTAAASVEQKPPSVIVHDSLQGQLFVKHNQVFPEDTRRPSGVIQEEIEEAVWAAVSKCHAHLQAGQGQLQTATPAKHCRLRLTLGQIDQLSGARAPRDRGQRLGSADPAPWMQHPEMTSLKNVDQVTMGVSHPGKANMMVTGVCDKGSGFEAYVVHPSDQEGGQAAWAAISQRVQC
ncbi:hypothetical protein DUNSADRAFT_11663 [Dunaliella salina]|uniref:Uncharacterized protein n=1 Tax=Dunaliella salina TaxID=3046 RepID=A0ABQ7GCZ3_DUNSA|nr:hypothetical protein DUNSADRAFT_11663 [Dunaliella salina]|eukprot:KAF5832436.1 hypothetical protein DUNSADRAFT_11663 [Dunaliella salina]